MKDFREHLAGVAHVSEEHAPYCVGWVRQVYQAAGRPLHEPSSSVEAEHLGVQAVTLRSHESPLRRQIGPIVEQSIVRLKMRPIGENAKVHHSA